MRLEETTGEYMKYFIELSVLSLLTVQIGCSGPSKYDKKHNTIQKQEAHEMINKSKDIEVKKGLGDDKIILKDE
jgi:pentose-5-phosphate-3-epimerase